MLRGTKKLTLQSMISTKENRRRGSWNFWSQHVWSKRICPSLVMNLIKVTVAPHKI